VTVPILRLIAVTDEVGMKKALSKKADPGDLPCPSHQTAPRTAVIPKVHRDTSI
jgi:hypothetical protein